MEQTPRWNKIVPVLESTENYIPTLFWAVNFIKAFNLLKPTGHVMHHQFNNSTTVRCAHTVFMCFVSIWEQTVTCATYSINWSVFITEMKSVYSAVRTGSLNKAVCASSVKG